ncbi:MAG: metal-dependent hydrolase [Hyphomicrobiaceae bacterium]|nr:metal-dependent hydrolase [Hyphomicrobiaceae bacterium]
MKITWLGHSAFRVETGASVVLMDPFLKSNPSFTGSGVAFADAIRGATHVVITHGHGDHVGDAVEIAKETGAKVVTNYDLCMWLAKQGVSNIDPMNTGGTTDQGDFKVTLVRADHSAALVEMDVGYPLGNANGVVLTPKSGPVLLHMGDTDVFSDMALIAALWKPEIGIVPIGDRFTMGARTAAYACRTYFKFKTVIPCHYATFGLLDATADAFVAEMTGQNVVVPPIGKAVTV